MNLSIARPSSVNHIGTILQRSLLVYIVILFFGDVAIYLSLAVSPRLDPQYWIGLLVVLAAALAWFSPHTRWEAFRTPVFFWCVAFLALTLILFAAIPTSHVEQLKERIRDVVLLTAFLAVFLMLRNEVPFLRKVILVAVVLGVVVNLISLAHNNFLRPPGIPWAYRPAGFYINPNESGIALTLGMLLSLNLLRKFWREAYTVFVLVGVAATFSREAVLLWLVVVACLCVLRNLSLPHLVLSLVVLIVIVGATFFALIKGHLIHGPTLDYYQYSVHRFDVFFKGVQADTSDESRLQFAKAGWELFLVHPVIGNGIGSTYHWSLPQSTHNMYLLYMDDYGIIGLFLYPLLIWCMIRGAMGETRKLAWTMAIFLLFWGLFDHNIVQNYYSLFAISLTAAMSRISATESAQRTQAIPAETAPG